MTVNKYDITISFKHKGSLHFELITEENLKENFIKEWGTNKKEGAITIGEYIISTDDVLWVRIQGRDKIGDDKVVEESSGKKL